MSNILEEVKKLLGKSAIELVPPGQEGQGFYSTFFFESCGMTDNCLISFFLCV
jgi:hypothetical protein